MPRGKVWRSGVIVAAAALFAFADARDSAASEWTRRGTPVRGEGFVVVVNEQNTVATMPRARVSRLFLKKVSRWDSGVVALPVDLPADSPVRDAFTRRVLSKSVGSVKAYWQQQIFSGRDVPPPEKPGDDAVLEFVQSNPAAIAYVSPLAPLPRGVRVLGVTD
jgi:ABC-type phosphate transport system substrate-binding protein